MEEIMNKYDTIGGRRFIMCMGACIVSSILLWFAKLDPKNFSDIIIWITGIYVTGNVTQRAGGAIPEIVSRVTGKITDTAAKKDPADTSDVVG